MTNREYAEQIAREWNANEEAAGYVGYVTRFRVTVECAGRYPARTVGGKEHSELWVPAEDLPKFNESIIGQIEVVAEFRGKGSNA